MYVGHRYHHLSACWFVCQLERFKFLETVLNISNITSNICVRNTRCHWILSTYIIIRYSVYLYYLESNEYVADISDKATALPYIFKLY